MDSREQSGANLPLLPYELKNASRESIAAYAERQLRVNRRIRLVLVITAGVMVLDAIQDLWQTGVTTRSVIRAALIGIWVVLIPCLCRSFTQPWLALIESLRQTPSDAGGS